MSGFSKIGLLLVATVLVSAVFTVFPQLDIWVSALFSDQTGFPLAAQPLPRFLRAAYLVEMYAFALLMLGAFLLSLSLGKQRRTPLRIWGYPLAVILSGPLLLVNSVLKEHWGRARPRDILEFGGELQFTPAYVMSDQCAANCSFTSGEGAGVATVAILTGVLVWGQFGKRGRMVLAALLGVYFVIGAGLRTATGGHFLSDTLLSALFCALIAAVLYRLFHMEKFRYLPSPKGLQQDWRTLLAKVKIR